SVAFHGTLLRGPQALDELPMVYAGLIGAWMLLHRGSLKGEGGGAAFVFGAYAVGFTLAYFVLEAYFEIFLLTFVAIVTYLTLASVWWTWIRPAPRLLSWVLLGAALSFMGGFFGCWIPEHLILPCDHPLQRLHLHAWWHLGSSTGVYLWFLWTLVDRWRMQGHGARWDRGFVVRDDVGS
ncbi:MAG: ceramidase domain-containing protein, partial [Myxococcales bacterium]|nr:ceramidase domain-containing protein [Myxococcales bacterium]